MTREKNSPRMRLVKLKHRNRADEYRISLGTGHRRSLCAHFDRSWARRPRVYRYRLTDMDSPETTV